MIVVPTKILVDQTAERFHQFAPDTEIGKLYTFAHDITRPVTITTYASLVRHIQNGTLDPRLYKLLVLDEVHRSLSGKRSQAVAQFTNAIKLGFTATPMYSEDRNVANLLNTEIHKMTIREAVAEDLLSPFSVIIAETEIDLSNVSIKSNGDYDEGELEEAINVAKRNQAAIDLYNQLFQGQTAVAYCTSVKHAQELAKLLSENGIAADFVSGYQDKKEQAETLRKYHEGEIKVLCNADILIEGFDEPKASVCLNLRPTKSMVVAQQRAGRVLRLDPANPNKHAVVVDFLDKTYDPTKLSVTFAEVAEAAFLTTKKVKGITAAGPAATPKVNGGDDIVEPFDEAIITISGLKVTINPREVMNIVKEMQEKKFLELQDTDFAITAHNLMITFTGGNTKLKELANLVIKKLMDSNKKFLTARKSGFKLVNVVTDRDSFIKVMIEHGAVLRSNIPEDIDPSEFPITYNSLQSIFRNSPRELKLIKQIAIEELHERDEDIITFRRSSGNMVLVTTNRDRFIKVMIDNGARERDVRIPKVEDADFVITQGNLPSIFTGNNTELIKQARTVAENLSKSLPGVIIKKTHQGHIVDVVIDMETFVQRMVALGAKLKDRSVQPVQDGNFLITQQNLKNNFIGSYSKIRPIASEILEELRVENDSLVAKRTGTNGLTINVVTNGNRFIEEMVKKGIRLKNQNND